MRHIKQFISIFFFVSTKFMVSRLCIWLIACRNSHFFMDLICLLRYVVFVIVLWSRESEWISPTRKILMNIFEEKIDFINLDMLEIIKVNGSFCLWCCELGFIFKSSWTLLYLRILVNEVYQNSCCNHRVPLLKLKVPSFHFLIKYRLI